MAKEDSECPVDVVNYLPGEHHTELHGLDVDVEIAPSKYLLGF